MDHTQDTHGTHPHQPGLTTHPWHGFAHPNHTPADSDHVIRTLRFANMQLTKFWIELQSVPVFMSGLKSPSIVDLETLFDWSRTSPDWKREVQDSRYISALTSPTYRKVLFGFMAEVEAIAALREKIALDQSARPESARSLLTQMNSALQLLSRLGIPLDNSRPSSIAQLIARTQDRIFQLESTSRFLGEVQARAGTAEITGNPTLLAAQKTLDALEKIRSTPAQFHSWRTSTILDSSQLKTIQLAGKTAHELRKARETLELTFTPAAFSTTEVASIRKAAETLKSAGMLSLMSQDFKNARQLHLELTAGNAKVSKEVMAEQLAQLADHLEQIQAFTTNSEFQAALGEHFKGLDTDFETAALACSSFAQLRESLSPAWFTLLATASSEVLQSLSVLASDEETRATAENVNQLLNNPGDAEMPISALEASAREALTQQETLQAILNLLELKPENHLAALLRIKAHAEQILALEARMSSDTNLLTLMKNDFRGADTDLTPIRQCLAYIQFIESSAIPSELKSTFLTPHGPQRLMETRGLLAAMEMTFMGTKEHLIKFEAVTYFQPNTWGNYGSLFEVPLPVLMNRMSLALKQPELFASFTEELRSGKA